MSFGTKDSPLGKFGEIGKRCQEPIVRSTLWAIWLLVPEPVSRCVVVPYTSRSVDETFIFSFYGSHVQRLLS